MSLFGLLVYGEAFLRAVVRRDTNGRKTKRFANKSEKRKRTPKKIRAKELQSGFRSDRLKML
jgi:hypothetical protein